MRYTDRGVPACCLLPSGAIITNSQIFDRMATTKRSTFDHLATTRLARAIAFNDVTAAAAALRDGANPNHRGPHQALLKTSLLQDAVTAGAWQCLALLLQHGARATLSSNDRRTRRYFSADAACLPLALQAIHLGKWQCLDVLIDAKRCSLFEPADTGIGLTPAAGLLEQAGRAGGGGRDEALKRLRRLCAGRRSKTVGGTALAVILQTFIRFHTPDHLDLLSQCGIDAAAAWRTGHGQGASGPELAWRYRRPRVGLDGTPEKTTEDAAMLWMKWFGANGIFWPEADERDGAWTPYIGALLDARRTAFTAHDSEDGKSSVRRPRPGL